jgi:hypothetical protein
MHIDTLHTSSLLVPLAKVVRVLDTTSKQCHLRMTSFPSLDFCNGSSVGRGVSSFGVESGVGREGRVDGTDDVATERQFHGSLDSDEGQTGAVVLEDVDQGWDDGLLVDVQVDQVRRDLLGDVDGTLLGWRCSRCVEGSRHEVSISGGVHGRARELGLFRGGLFKVIVMDRDWVVKAQLMIETLAFALGWENFFLDGDLRLDVVVAGEDVGSLDVDAQVGDLVRVILKVGQEHAPARGSD